MKGISMFVVLAFLALASALQQDQLDRPPNCTRLTKNGYRGCMQPCHSDYATSSPTRLDYPEMYMAPGQKEVFQPLRCIRPSEVIEAVTVVCDWAAPPLVQFTSLDGYVFVRRQDPSNRFPGNAVINTYQKCSHEEPQHQTNYNSVPTVIKMH